MSHHTRTLFVCTLLILSQVADTLAGTGADSSCATSRAITVISGDALNGLTGTPAQQVSLYRYSNSKLSPIDVQIDQRDSDGLYLLNEQSDVDKNDELVFATADIGSRLPADSARRKQLQLTELRISAAAGRAGGWVYASPLKVRRLVTATPRITYSQSEDSIETDIYRIGFSSRTPFLVDSLQWNLGKDNQWSPDLIDSMKIRHQGKLFGLISFERSQKDYTSLLAEVKTGPFRVIRRTANRVRVFWQLDSPSLNIDYVMSPDGFVMDTVIDIPFSPGLFFSSLETLTTVDWNPSPELPPIFIASGDGSTRLRISGKTSEKVDAFNRLADKRFLVQTRLGTMDTRLDIPENLPVKSILYLRDDIAVADPPEQFSGQFGNVGFRTTGWEDINAGIHHLKFTVCFSSGNS